MKIERTNHAHEQMKGNKNKNIQLIERERYILCCVICHVYGEILGRLPNTELKNSWYCTVLQLREKEQKMSRRARLNFGLGLPCLVVGVICLVGLKSAVSFRGCPITLGGRWQISFRLPRSRLVAMI